MTQINAERINFRFVLYAQQFLYPDFSNGEMYVALMNGFLDPASLGLIKIFEVGRNLHCIDTRRLKIIKELQRRNKYDLLKHFTVQYVQEDDEDFTNEYWNLVNCHIPAMKREGLDGSTIQIPCAISIKWVIFVTISTNILLRSILICACMISKI
jgi:hypothetical protein